MARLPDSLQIQIPVVDISKTNAEQSIADQLVHAAEIHGFVYIKNLGRDIPIKDINHAFDLSKKFFTSPVEEKNRVIITENNHGWGGMHSETLDSKTQRIGDFKEAFNFGEFIDNRAQQHMPASLAAHESEIADFFAVCRNLCLRILTLLGLGLHIPSSSGGADWFASRHSFALGPSGSTLRLLYYPSVSESADYQPEVDIRAGAHSDYGSITLLFQRPGQPGLEILTQNGSWCPVPVNPPGTESDPSPPILVNVGDLLEFWTNGLFRSTVHRVVFPKDARRGGEDRYSIAFFCHPVDDTVLEPVPSDQVSLREAVKGFGHGNGAGKVPEDGKSITAKEHLQQRLQATYLSLYEKERNGKEDIH